MSKLHNRDDQQYGAERMAKIRAANENMEQKQTEQEVDAAQEKQLDKKKLRVERVAVMLTKDDRTALRMLAAAEDMTLSTYCQQVLSRHVANKQRLK